MKQKMELKELEWFFIKLQFKLFLTIFIDLLSLVSYFSILISIYRWKIFKNEIKNI